VEKAAIIGVSPQNNDSPEATLTTHFTTSSPTKTTKNSHFPQKTPLKSPQKKLLK
jgi:hypothetical protein